MSYSDQVLCNNCKKIQILRHEQGITKEDGRKDKKCEKCGVKGSFTSFGSPN